MAKATLVIAAALFASMALPGDVSAARSRSRGAAEVSRSDWGVSFKPPENFEVSTNDDKLVVLKNGDLHLLVRPAQVASVREARVYAKRGVHGHGFMLDAEDLPEETKVKGHDAAAVQVTGTDRGGNNVEGRIVTAVGSGGRGVQFVAIGPAQSQDEVRAAMDALIQSVDFSAASNSRSARKRRR